jgi:DNA-binding SARP family transcriptional activator
MPESSTRNNLRQVLFSLRKAFPEVASVEDESEPVPVFVADRQSVQVNPFVAIDLDLHRIDQLLEDVGIHEHLNLAGCEACVQKLVKVVRLYRGNFLAYFYLEDSTEFEEWAEANREVHRNKALNTLEKLAEIHIQKGVYEEAIRYAER